MLLLCYLYYTIEGSHMYVGEDGAGDFWLSAYCSTPFQPTVVYTTSSSHLSLAQFTHV